jgi:hypothetical protein
MTALRPVLGAVLALVLCAAAGVGAAMLPDRAQLTTLYVRDHHGQRPAADAELAPYSAPFAAILGACAIDAKDLMNATVYMTGHAAAFPGAGPMSNLIMLKAISDTVTVGKHRDCWNTLNVVERRIEAADATKLIVDRPQVTALYVYDHNGRQPKDDVDLLPYAQAFQRIVASCNDSAEDLPGMLVDMSDQATELGVRTISTMTMMAAVARRIQWHGHRDCTETYDQAEGHVEGGGS